MPTNETTDSLETGTLAPSLNGPVPPDDQADGDYTFMLLLAEALYPPLRKFYKRDRANTYFNDRGKPADVPLHRAFRLLLDLMERAQNDPACVDRFRAHLEDLEGGQEAKD